MPSLRHLAATLALLAGGFAVQLPSDSLSELAAKRFEDYARRHARRYSTRSAEFAQRRALFERAVHFVAEQNSKPNRLWSAALNHLADRTDQELAALRGYSRNARPGRAAGSSMATARQIQFVSVGMEVEKLEGLPSDFSWKAKLNATSEVMDQTTCGSCWAFAAAGVLRGHAELFDRDRTFSTQQIISCTANPQHCGGDGGCQGATVELAMDYVVKKGIVDNSAWAYTGKEEKERCSQVEAAFAQVDSGEGLDTAGPIPSGYLKLPENNVGSMMTTLHERGPVAASLASGYRWNLYSSGILDACDKDAIIDHAIVVVGWGEGKKGAEKGVSYWTIQNSWGDTWGEGGFLRLQRQSTVREEGKYCGIDSAPELGSGCQGGPRAVEVCGSCGILYDMVVPQFKLTGTGLWQMERKMRGLKQQPIL